MMEEMRGHKIVKLLFQVFSALSALINIIAFSLLTNNIFDVVSFSLQMAELCMTLTILAGILLVLGILLAKRPLLIGIEWAINAGTWLGFYFKKRGFLGDLFANGFITDGTVNAMKLILLANITLCVVQGIILIATAVIKWKSRQPKYNE